MNSTNDTLLFDRFLIMYNLCVFTCIMLIFVFHCTYVRMSYVLNSYLLSYQTNTRCLLITNTADEFSVKYNKAQRYIQACERQTMYQLICNWANVSPQYQPPQLPTLARTPQNTLLTASLPTQLYKSRGTKYSLQTINSRSTRLPKLRPICR